MTSAAIVHRKYDSKEVDQERHYKYAVAKDDRLQNNLIRIDLNSLNF